MDIKTFDPKNLKNVVVTTPLIALNKEQVYELQVILDFLDYKVGSLDGIMGKKTKKAFAEFKHNTYQVDPELIGKGSVETLLKLLDEERDQIEWESPDEDQPESNFNPSITTVNWNDFKCPISKYFIVGEATHHDKKRIPTDNNVKSNILKLAKELDKVREAWGGAIGVTSWYRPPAINQSVGGAKYSQHLNGCAADIYPIGKNITTFQQWIDQRWFGALGYGAHRGFVHLDSRNNKGFETGGTKDTRWNY